MPYSPTPAQRKASNYKRRSSDRLNGETHPNNQLQIKSNCDTGWDNPYIDRIEFDIEQVAEKRPDTYSRKFWVMTIPYIPQNKLKQLLTKAMPECSVYPLWAYRLRHIFDVKLHKPVRFDTFIWRCCMALEGHL